jgi:hypothetical protein
VARARTSDDRGEPLLGLVRAAPPAPSAFAGGPDHLPAPFGEDFIVVEASRSQHQARRYPLHPGDEAWSVCAGSTPSRTPASP